MRYVTRGKYFQYPEEKRSFSAHEYFSENTACGSLEQEKKENEAPSGTTTPGRATIDYAEAVAPSSMFGAE